VECKLTYSSDGLYTLSGSVQSKTNGNNQRKLKVNLLWLPA